MKIEKRELLRYLGYRGQQYDEKIEQNIDAAISLCLEKITPRSIVKKYALSRDPLALKGTNMLLKGKNIAEHLEDCNEVYILGATVGFELEKCVAKLMKENPLLGVMVDSAGTCAIESYCDDICEELQRQNAKQLTWRFSCGYGDFPLEQQKDFVTLLEMGKRIGVFLHEESMMMTPQKSVTAIVGIKESQSSGSGAKCGSKCSNCGRGDCDFKA